MSSTRFLVLAFLGAVLGACAGEPNSIVCPTTGITCPEGTVCAAAQPVCLVSACGNGRSDLGEECDDGNILEGDGCSPTCKHEVCGNGTMDPGEACDDGNTDAGDGCSADCRTMEGCGNGTIDFGEDCDDANDDNTDACVKCHNAACGDGYKRDGVEECDGDNQGNPDVVGDGCSSMCLLEGCHNGRLDPGEECDDGNFDNTDACVLECKTGTCGDGVIRTGVEECDGDVGPDDTCSDTCHFLSCGNGIKDPGEQCDDHNNDPGDGCSPTCTFENCGNGVVDQGEQCDDGAETAACNANCTTSVCGDGQRNALDGEECDDGAGNSNSGNCTAGTPGVIDGCKLSVCGDGFVDQAAPGIEACDEGAGGNMNDGVGCSTTCMFEGCGNGILDNGEQCEDGNMATNDGCINCKLAVCGDGFVQADVEQCDVGSTPPAGHANATCGASGTAKACRWIYCGNGVIDGNEQCDDGNNDSLDGCTATCIREFCGDGRDNNGTAEQCDGNGTGTGGETAGCDIDCTTTSCGDGVVNDKFVPAGAPGGEQCDPPSATNGCSALCQFERCGNSTIDPGEQCDGAALGTPPAGAMNVTCGSTGVTACRWIFCGNGITDAGEQCDNGTTGPNNNNDTHACKADCTVNTCGDGDQLAGIEGCDLGTGNGADKACTPNCQPNICGDGFPETTGGVEECDDGNASNLDACTTTCKLPECGDGQVNGMPGTETCDDGNTMDEMAGACTGYNTSCGFCNMDCSAPILLTGPHCGDGTCQSGSGENANSCAADCPSMCGNNVRELGEACDNGMTSGDGCSSMCQVELGFACTGALGASSTCASTCGDGFKASNEGCDDGNTDPNDGCPHNGANKCQVASGWTCTGAAPSVCTMNAAPAMCGNGVVEGTEQCDNTTPNNDGVKCISNDMPPAYGEGNACAACNSSCVLVVSSDYCGDGTLNGTEDCDGSAMGAGTCTSEGFDGGGSLTCTAACGYDTSACTYDLDVMKSGTGTGTVTSDVGGINCGSTCSGSYAANTVVTLTATPAASSSFTSWSGACTGAGTCAVTMSASKTVTAEFAPLCGNGAIDGTEECDMANLNSASCTTITGGFTGGMLACKTDCTFDTTACMP